MDPATAALIIALVNEVGIPVARSIAAAVRAKGHPDVAQAIEDALSRSDATLDAVIDTARREQR